MTKGEREYLEKICRDAAKRANLVHTGKLMPDIFKTDEQRLAFAQGVWDLNQLLEAFLGIKAE